MDNAIVIGSTTNTKDWLQNCLNSFNGYNKYPIIVVINDDFELGKLKWVYEHTKVDQIFLLHDTVEIKDPSLFEVAFDFDGSYALSNQPVYLGMFLGKYRREILDQMIIPETKTKMEAVLAEISFNNEYERLEQKRGIICQPIVNTSNFEEKFGRNNMILENDYIKKYKGTWSLEMVK